MAEYTLSNGRTLTLRAPTPDDAAALVAFHKRVGGETDFLTSDKDGIPGLTEPYERAYLQNTLDMANTKMWLGFLEDELVCLCDVRAEQRPRLAHNGSVGIVVQESAWHLGIGHILMQEMVAFAKANGVLRRLMLDVRADNERAIRLYREFGFSECGRAHGYLNVRGAYFDMLQMERLL